MGPYSQRFAGCIGTLNLLGHDGKWLVMFGDTYADLAWIAPARLEIVE